MSQKSIFQRAALLASMALCLPMHSLYAQEEDDSAATGDQPIEEMVVTGSRIKKANLVSSSPVTQIDSEEFQFRGITRVEDLINDLPQVTASNTSGDSNGATGTATIDLRGLGDIRTLVLLNGRRLPYGAPSGGAIAPDINQVPAGLIERVEILTGGASAVYGSDAVSGVVNFITKDDFEGFRIDYQRSFYQHKNDSDAAQAVRDANFTLPKSSVSDGDTDDISIMLGTNTGDGRGNVTAYASYRNIKAITQAQRDYSACALDGTPDAFTCGGSSTIPAGRFSDFGGLANPPEDRDANGDCNNPGPIDPDTGEPTCLPVAPWAPTGAEEWPGSFDYLVDGNAFVNRSGHPDALYNYGPLNYFQRPDKRTTFGVMGHNEFSENATVYTELNFMDDRSVAQIAPSGNFFVTEALNCNNPLMTDAQRDQICGQYLLAPDESQSVLIGRRNVEGGPRRDDIRITSYRSVLGVRGDIGSSNWDYDVSGNFSKVAFVNTYHNDLSTTRIIRALNVVPDTRADTLGEPVCQSVLDGSDPNCVPWNIFEEGGVTQDAIDYLTLPLYARGETKQMQMVGFVTGDLNVSLPSANTGIKVAGGLEYREEALIFEPDNGFTSGDGAGQGGPIQGVNGKFDVKEFFGETNIPLVEGASIADRISLDLGYRRSEYSNDKETNTYKIAADWALNSSLTFRASMQRAARAANVRELFRPLAITLFDMGSDPCAGEEPSATLEQCQRMGVTNYGNISDSPAGQYNEMAGGNPNLEPEESNTVSFGMIFSHASGFNLSIDYFDIDIEDAIDNIDSAFIIDQCISLSSGYEEYCALIHRDPERGTLWIGQDHVFTPDVNTGFLQTVGFDIAADYEMSLGDQGSLGLSLIATLLDTWDEQPVPGAAVTDCVGKWGSPCGVPRPEWAHNMRAVWTTPWEAVLSATWRHIGAVDTITDDGADFSSQNYLDVSALWQVHENVTMRFGISNLLDRDPPITASDGAGPSIFGNGNTFPGVYDALGRYIFIGAALQY